MRLRTVADMYENSEEVAKLNLRRRKRYKYYRNAAFIPATLVFVAAIALWFAYSQPDFASSFPFEIYGSIIGLMIAGASALVAVSKIRLNAPSEKDFIAGVRNATWSKHNVEVAAFTASVAAVILFSFMAAINSYSKYKQAEEVDILKFRMDQVEEEVVRRCDLLMDSKTETKSSFCLKKDVPSAKP